jgi:translation initiation factor 2 alpha subunit (eIF-2alpha)
MTKCEECDANISDKVAEFSDKKYGKHLCMDCQKKVSPSWKKSEDKVEHESVRSCDREELILRQVALKGAVELAKVSNLGITTVKDVLEVASELNDWLNK